MRERLIAALTRIVKGETSVNGQTFPGYMESEGFDHTWRAGDDFADYLVRVDMQFGDLLKRPEFRQVRSGRVGPNDFPKAAAWIAVVCLVVIGINTATRGNQQSPLSAAEIHSVNGASTSTAFSPGTLIAFVAVPIATAAYAVFADEFGFIPIAAVILLVLSLLLKAPVPVAVLLSAVASPVIYLVFTDLLRVPLPPGWFG